MSLYIQGARYIIVGVVSNAVLYACFIVLTGVGVGHKTAMTILYVAGVLQTFFLIKIGHLKAIPKCGKVFPVM
ncbi:MAG: hypothetical protein Q4G66_07305 [bacterium]|nr:hypothetical protein [bacterium]